MADVTMQRSFSKTVEYINPSNGCKTWIKHEASAEMQVPHEKIAGGNDFLEGIVRKEVDDAIESDLAIARKPIEVAPNAPYNPLGRLA